MLIISNVAKANTMLHVCFFQHECRQLFCPLGQFFKHGKCLSPIKSGWLHTSYLLFFRLQPANGRTSETVARSTDELIDNTTNGSLCSIMEELKETLIESFEKTLQCGLLRVIAFSATLYNRNQIIQSISNFNGGANMSDLSESIFVSSEILLHVKLSKGCDLAVIGRNLLKLRTSTYEVSTGTESSQVFQAYADDRAYTMSTANVDHECSVTGTDVPTVLDVPQQKVVDLLVCQQVELDKNEFETLDEYSIFIPAISTRLGLSKFIIIGERVRVCVADYFGDISDLGKNSSVNSYIANVYIVCLSVSLVCILITLLTFYLFPQYCCLPGKLNVFLEVTLFLAVIFLVLSHYTHGINSACLAVGTLLHFWWLSFFCSLNAYCFQMYRIFCLGAREKLHKEVKNVKFYVTYIIGVPATILCFSIVVNFALSGSYGYGFDGSICFFKWKFWKGITFTLPVSLSVGANTVFFVITLKNNCSHFQSFDGTVFLYQLRCFAKLFAVTCIMWPFQLLDDIFEYTKLNSNIFAVVSTVMNSSEGILIFLVFVCNINVYCSYRELFTGSKGSEEKDREIQRKPTSHIHIIADVDTNF